MTRLWLLARRYWFDALIVAMLGAALAGVVYDYGSKAGPRGPLWFDILATIGMTTLLFARRRFPVGALVAIGILIAGSAFVDHRLMSDDFVSFLVGLAVAVLFGTWPNRLISVAGLAFTVGVAEVVVSNDPNSSGGDYVWNAVSLSVAWIVGFAVGGKGREAEEARERAAQAEREREERALRAVSDERARIARELHDVVGHSVSVMTVQASAVRRLLDEDQDRERESLVVVEQTGREALAEMRRLVGVLRRPEEAPALAPQPSLEHLARLVDQVREAGLRVDVRVEGDAVQLPASVDLTAYRLVQEGLTNALKHARAERAEVVVRYDDGHVEVTVSDDGRGGGDGEKGGHGLVGMRERVSVYGGELEAGPRPDGGYRLRARLPVRS
ncbi:MAG TPA: sensor histidine kinase [Gaiellaceae bacterium]|nr:sensor histidine kinase [Gaiellaceae bacterium]